MNIQMIPFCSKVLNELNYRRTEKTDSEILYLESHSNIHIPFFSRGEWDTAGRIHSVISGHVSYDQSMNVFSTSSFQRTTFITLRCDCFIHAYYVQSFPSEIILK